MTAARLGDGVGRATSACVAAAASPNRLATRGTRQPLAPRFLVGGRFKVPLEARVSREQIFGPVAAITVFDTEDEAVAAAYATEFGLVSYLFTENIGRALRVSERLESGMVGLNTGLVSNPAAPFGGIKQSGLGREGGRVGIEEYLDTKYVAIALGG